MLYERGDMIFKDYDWTNAEDLAKFKDDPDRNLLIRNQGYDMLINFICEQRKYMSKTHAGKMEILIHDKLPFGLKSQYSVFNWL